MVQTGHTETDKFLDAGENASMELYGQTEASDDGDSWRPSNLITEIGQTKCDSCTRNSHGFGSRNRRTNQNSQLEESQKILKNRLQPFL